MKAGEAFEIECCDYLNEKYGNDRIVFLRHDTADSTDSDIEVIIDDDSAFFIEAKDMAAQSGQFVLLPDEKNRKFVFSTRNHSEPNEMTTIMINYMNSEFDRFNSAGTAGEKLDLSSDVFVNWIIGHYKEKNAKYVMSRKKEFIILPIDRFGDYFSVEANFRIKKSGSTEPSLKYADEVIAAIKEKFNVNEIYKKKIGNKNKIFAVAEPTLNKVEIDLKKYTYFLAIQDEENGLFEVRQLSNTRNKNVIFTITVKQEQATEDLQKFESDLFA